MSAKQTEAALIVWCTLMKSAASGLRNEIHARLYISYSFDPTDASRVQRKRPEVSSRREDDGLFESRRHRGVSESLSSCVGRERLLVDEDKFTVAEKIKILH